MVMELIKWSEERHRLGVREVDYHHRRMIAVVNSLQTAVSLGESREFVCNILSMIEEYSRDHFCYEERLMHFHGYPARSAKKRSHESFIRQVETLSREYGLGNMTVSADTMRFLREWLDHHIVEEDRRYSPFIFNKGDA